jgi:hypothetical protein
MHQHAWLTDLLRGMSGFIQEAQLVHVQAQAVSMGFAPRDEGPSGTPTLAARAQPRPPMLRLVLSNTEPARWN